jgi:hypothetical protein
MYISGTVDVQVPLVLICTRENDVLEQITWVLLSVDLKPPTCVPVLAA